VTTSSPAGHLAPIVLALCVLAALASPVAAAPAPQTTDARPAPPLTSEIDVPLDAAIGPAAARRAPSPAAARAGDPKAAPRLYPETRVAAVYGAPQLGATIVGQKSPAGSAAEAQRLALRFGELDARPAQAGIDLIATVATADRGPDGLYRTRQSAQLIAAYHDAVRAAGGRLVLDIQPGRSTFIREARVLEEWLLEPDVDLALDPEWNVGRKGVPGVTQGKVKAKEVDKVSRYLARLVRDNALPQKALYVHQFREGSVRKRRAVKQRGTQVAVTLNFDGIGSPGAKVAGYRNLSQPGLFNGFSVFVSRDSNPMGFQSIVDLEPPADYVMYQ
jgi:hypothetical protein